MKITLDIPNKHSDFFLQLLKSLNLEIKIESTEDIPEWHKSILEDRLSKYEKADKSNFLKWEDVKKQIETNL
jgi:organic radical activating enzyme